MSKPNPWLPGDDVHRWNLAQAVKSVPKLPQMTPVECCRAIVQQKQANRVGGLFVDHFTASCIVQIYDAVNDENKAKLNAMPIRKLAAVCWKVAKKVSP